MTLRVEPAVITQKHLEKILHSIFREEDILSNARKETEIKNPETNYFMEVDTWVPKYKLCFEFQDPYHYVSSWDFQKSVLESIQADSLKHELLCQRGETLIAVPCWWEGDINSLMATIIFQRPDLFHHLNSIESNDEPISVNPPLDFFKDFSLSSTIPVIGEPMLASFVKSSSFKVSPTNSWWMGEKYDGVRFCWNLKAHRLYSRNALKITVPLKVVSLINAPFLDGEIWFGRGQFVEAQKLVVSSDSAYIPWSLLRMTVFDDPNPSTQHLAFEKRYASALASVLIDSPFLVVATRMLCKAKKQLTNMLMHSIDQGGEGIILRKPGSIYEHGRSANLLKLKATRGDNEALVVNAENASSLLLQLPNGMTFRAPSPKLSSDQPKIKKGDIVTFLFESFSKNSIPLKAEICRVRRDTTWTHVVQDFSASAPKKNVLNESSQALIKSSPSDKPKPYRFWTRENFRNLRHFFEQIAKNRNFDPLVAENWYPLTNKIVESYKGGEYALRLFGASLNTAISQLFPEIGVDRAMFKAHYQRYWFEVKNRRKYFEEYAVRHGFDPLNADNWYSVQKESIIYEGGRGIIDFYPQSNIRAAIMHVFPEIGLDMNKFPTKDRFYWRDPDKRREFFINFAEERNFDPLIASNWYSISREDINSTKGGYAVLEYYEKRSHHAALVHLFPDIGINSNNFFRREASISTPQLLPAIIPQSISAPQIQVI